MIYLSHSPPNQTHCKNVIPVFSFHTLHIHYRQIVSEHESFSRLALTMNYEQKVVSCNTVIDLGYWACCVFKHYYTKIQSNIAKLFVEKNEIFFAVINDIQATYRVYLHHIQTHSEYMRIKYLRYWLRKLAKLRLRFRCVNHILINDNFLDSILNSIISVQ